MNSFIRLVSSLWDYIYIYLIENETTNYSGEIKIVYHCLAGRLMASQTPVSVNMLHYMTRVNNVEGWFKFGN